MIPLSSLVGTAHGELLHTYSHFWGCALHIHLVCTSILGACYFIFVCLLSLRELHCMFNQIRLPQERWDIHLSSSDIPPQHVPCRCIEGTLQQIMFHSFLAVTTFTVWRSGMDNLGPVRSGPVQQVGPTIFEMESNRTDR